MSTPKNKRIAESSTAPARADKGLESLDFRWWWQQNDPAGWLGLATRAVGKDQTATRTEASKWADLAYCGTPFLYEVVRRLPEARAKLPHFAWPPYPDLHIIEQKLLFQAAFAHPRWRPAAIGPDEGWAETLKPVMAGYATVADGWRFNLSADEDEAVRVFRKLLAEVCLTQGIIRKSGPKGKVTRNRRGKLIFDWKDIELLDRRPGQGQPPLTDPERKKKQSLRKLGCKFCGLIATALTGTETAKLEYLVTCLFLERLALDRSSRNHSEDLLDELLLAADWLRFKKPLADYRLLLPETPQAPDDPRALSRFLKEHFAVAYDEALAKRLAGALKRIRSQELKGLGTLGTLP